MKLLRCFRLFAFILPLWLAILLGTLCVRGQSARPSDTRQESVSRAPVFDAVSVKPTSPANSRVGLGIPPGRFVASGQTAKKLIEFAYDLKDDQLSGGENWVGTSKYDIDAKETVSHHTKELPVYALVVAKNGSKLTKTPEGTSEDPDIAGGRGQFTGTNVPISALANAVSLLPEIGGRTVLDRTGLKDNYDFKLQWTPESVPPPTTGGPGDASKPGDATLPDSSGPSVFTALQQQLGLRLEITKAPVNTIVIEHIEQPAPN